MCWVQILVHTLPDVAVMLRQVVVMAVAGPEQFLLTCWAVRSVKMLTFKIYRCMTTQKIKHGQQVTQLATWLLVNGLIVSTAVLCDCQQITFTI
jgi:hypothetical protein